MAAERKTYHFFAREGLPVMAALLLVAAVSGYYGIVWLLAISVILLLLAAALYSDPQRELPSDPLAVLSPVDGEVVEISQATGADSVALLRITIRNAWFGSYTARSPIEGKIMNSQADNYPAGDVLNHPGLWLQTDEGSDVILAFSGSSLGTRPRTFVRVGERLGHGQRCADLRLALHAEVLVSADAKLAVTEGQRVRAGQSIIARLPSGS